MSVPCFLSPVMRFKGFHGLDERKGKGNGASVLQREHHPPTRKSQQHLGNSLINDF
jgi:hypothetical protein